MNQLVNLETMPLPELKEVIRGAIQHVQSSMMVLIPAMLEVKRRGVDPAELFAGLEHLYRRLKPAFERRLAPLVAKECLNNESAMKRFEKLPIPAQEEIVAMKSLPVYTGEGGDTSFRMTDIAKMVPAELEMVIDVDTATVRPVGEQIRWLGRSKLTTKVRNRKHGVKHDPVSNVITAYATPQEILNYIKTKGLR